MTEKLLESAITESVIAAFFEVYNELGHGFLESVYERSLAMPLTQAGHVIQQQRLVNVFFRGRYVGFFGPIS